MATRCPYCFVDLNAVPAAFRCAAEACSERVDPKASAISGEQVSARPVTVVPPGTVGWSAVQCHVCGAGASIPACPHCHATLPPGWSAISTTCVVMAGARASGKSIYIAVLKRQSEILAEMLGGVLRPLNARVDQVYTDNYQAPLYEQRGLIPATSRHATAAPAQRTPLIFSLGRLGGREQMLVIRDVAGEDLEDGTADANVFGFFRHADAIFFLFDPLRIEQIRHLLAGVVPEQRVVGGDPLMVLDNLARLLRHGGHAITAPLAVILAKFDTLYELRRVAASPWSAAMRNKGAAYARDPSLDHTAYDAVDGALLEAEVTSLLARLGGQALLNRLEADFPTRRLFAVSALGASPTGHSLDPRGIAPFRCIDPLKWVLTRSAGLPVA